MRTDPRILEGQKKKNDFKIDGKELFIIAGLFEIEDHNHPTKLVRLLRTTLLLLLLMLCPGVGVHPHVVQLLHRYAVGANPPQRPVHRRWVEEVQVWESPLDALSGLLGVVVRDLGAQVVRHVGAPDVVLFVQKKSTEKES